MQPRLKLSHLFVSALAAGAPAPILAQAATPAAAPTVAAVTPQPAEARGAERAGTLGGVSFAPGKPLLTDASLPRLDSLAQELLAHPDERVAITAPPFEPNTKDERFQLSIERALSVRAYLVLHGVPGDRVAVHARSAASAGSDDVTVTRLDAKPAAK